MRHNARPNNPKFVIEVLKNILPTINKAIAITAPGIAYPATDRLIKILLASILMGIFFNYLILFFEIN